MLTLILPLIAVVWQLYVFPRNANHLDPRKIFLRTIRLCVSTSFLTIEKRFINITFCINWLLYIQTGRNVCCHHKAWKV